MRSSLPIIAALLASPAEAADGFEIAAIRVHLFYESTGTLSDDLLTWRPILYNTVIGATDTREPASDILVVVEMTGPPDTGTTTPLTIEAVDAGDPARVLATRSFDFVETRQGSEQLARALYVPDATCTRLRITARHGEDGRAVELPFECGE